MGAIRTAFAALALLAATPAHADSVTRWRPYIAEASGRFGVPVEWIERVIRAESAGLLTFDGRPITSHAGAMGLMQLMPGTWAQMRVVLRLGGDPYDPRDNILAGTAYLRLMYDRFGYPGLFAAYNAGPARYAAYLVSGRALPGETRAYLASVSGAPAVRAGAVITAPVNTIFFTPRSPPSPTLFVPLGLASVRGAESRR
ncbi:lytic transglycosylase domain-containing protein [Sphingomonas koreensis]|nr:lytic transglycosylase domain-containing protein [Sphingomonas koreensis]